MDWTEFGKAILEQVLPVLGALIAALAAVALQKLQKKLGIELSAKEQASLMEAARKGIAYAEEKAARELKLDVSSEDRQRGAQKAQWAKGFVQAQFPKLKDEALDRLLDAELASMTGVGATGNWNVADDGSTVSAANKKKLRGAAT